LLPDGAEIEKIELPGVSIAKGADGKSWAATPATAAASPGELQQLVDAWKSERAMWCQLDEGTLDPTAESVTVTLKDRKLNFRVVSREPQLVLAAPDFKLRYTLSKADADKLLKLPTAKPATPAAATSVALPGISAPAVAAPNPPSPK
jgi:hypothetical protein